MSVLSAEERDDFLTSDDPPLVCAVSTLNEDGSPHVVSVWYRWHDGRVLLWSLPELRWPRNLMRDPRAAVVVFEHELPLRAVYVSGVASIRRGPLPELLDELRPIVARYSDDPDATIAAYDSGGDQLLVTIDPASIVGKANG